MHNDKLFPCTVTPLYTHEGYTSKSIFFKTEFVPVKII
jgi:hypothetical protein